jgi:hypothetical protein
MNPILARIERQLMEAVEASVSRRRARRRVLMSVAAVGGLLLLASVASAVTGVGPAGGLFATDEGLPPSARPEPGGRRAVLHAGGEGRAGWDLLVYSSRRPRLIRTTTNPLCVALARGDSKPIPRGGLDQPPGPQERYGGSVACGHPALIAARLLRKEFELGGDRGGAYSPGLPASPSTPYYGLILADAVELSLHRAGEGAVAAKLSPPFSVEIEPLSPTDRRNMNPRQLRAVRGLPPRVRVRAFLGALDTLPLELGDRVPDVTIRARFGDGRVRSKLSRGHVIRPERVSPSPFERKPGGASTRLAAQGPDGIRWEAVGFEAAGGGLSAAASKAPWTGRRGSLFGSSSHGVLDVLSRRAIQYDAETGRPDGAMPKTSYALYGFARADVRSIVFARPGVARVRARLSPPFVTARWDRRALRSILTRRERRRVLRLPRAVRVRLFLAVAPPAARGLRPRVTLADGTHPSP